MTLITTNATASESPHRPSNPQQTLLSVIVPCYQEEEVIAETYRQLTQVLRDMASSDYELLFVDDGSTDSTLSLLSGIQASDERVQVFSLARNFGHQIAITAGLEHCTGDAVVIIDADLQDPPELIPDMLVRWRAGVDVVYAVRKRRAGESHFKLVLASGFYRLLDRLSEVDIPLDTGDFRLLDRRVVDAVVQLPERDRFVRGIVSWVGFRQEPIYFERHPRYAGQTKYTLRKMLRFAIDGILSFSSFPLRWAAPIGLVAIIAGALGLVWAAMSGLGVESGQAQTWSRESMLSMALIFIGGIQLLFLSVLGEYIGRIYGEVKRRPLYVIKSVLGKRAHKPLNHEEQQ